MVLAARSTRPYRRPSTVFQTLLAAFRWRSWTLAPCRHAQVNGTLPVQWQMTRHFNRRNHETIDQSPTVCGPRSLRQLRGIHVSAPAQMQEMRRLLRPPSWRTVLPPIGIDPTCDEGRAAGHAISSAVNQLGCGNGGARRSHPEGLQWRRTQPATCAAMGPRLGLPVGCPVQVLCGLPDPAGRFLLEIMDIGAMPSRTSKRDPLRSNGK